MKKDLIFLGIETSCDETAALVKKSKNGKVKIPPILYLAKR